MQCLLMHVSVDSEPILARCPRQHALDDASSLVRVDNNFQNGREQDRQSGGGKQYRRRFEVLPLKHRRCLSSRSVATGGV